MKFPIFQDLGQKSLYPKNIPGLKRGEFIWSFQVSETLPKSVIPPSPPKKTVQVWKDAPQFAKLMSSPPDFPGPGPKDSSPPHVDVGFNVLRCRADIKIPPPPPPPQQKKTNQQLQAWKDAPQFPQIQDKYEPWVGLSGTNHHSTAQFQQHSKGREEQWWG